MKKFFEIFLFMSLLVLAACDSDNSSVVFTGKGENWKGELVTSYNFKGEEIQSISLSYIGDNPDQVKETNIFVESSDFLGWGLGEIELDERGNFNSGEVFKLDSKTPTTSKILLKIDGDHPENITLTSDF